MSSLFLPWRATRELLTPAEMARADSVAVASGVASYDLMLRAGEAVADVAARLVLPLWRTSPRIDILCGPGGNGGDGFVAARALERRGFGVRVFALTHVARLKGDALQAARDWGKPPIPLADWRPKDCDLVVDALFGAGLARDLDGLAVSAVGRLNAWRARGGRVVAVDVPSGLDGATGQVRGAAAQADATVTFFRLKPGHLLLPGRDLCGDLHLAHIGIPDPAALQQIAPSCCLNSPKVWGETIPGLARSAHKYTRGHALVLSGPAFHTGASRLAAMAAARIGAGLVTIAGTSEALAQHAAHVTAIMLAPIESPEDLTRVLADRRKNALVIGPGLGLDAQARALLDAALAPGQVRALVLDADALTHFEGDARGLGERLAAHGGVAVLTPHEGEYARLVKGLSDEAESSLETAETGDKLARARLLARVTGAIVLLKGADTIVAAPDGRACIAADLPPTLATAGSGDVLSGMIGGLLAQGMPGFEASACAVWLHGRAATRLGRGLIADDLPAAVGACLGDLEKEP